MLFPEEVDTDRLRMRRLSHQTVDVFEYYRVCSHHEPGIQTVTEYLPWSVHESVKQTTDYIDNLESQWEAGTRAEYLIRPKDDEPDAGEIAGSGGLLVDWETQTGRPAIWLRKQFWGRGYAGERAEAMIELAFDTLELDLVAIPVEDGNEKSRRAVETYIAPYNGQYDGLIRNATTRPDGRTIDHHRYTITREQYRDSMSSQ